MKNKREIKEKLKELGTKIEHIYNERKKGNMIDKDSDILLYLLQIREDMLEWVIH